MSSRNREFDEEEGLTPPGFISRRPFFLAPDDRVAMVVSSHPSTKSEAHDRQSRHIPKHLNP
jgi:hypothetical protein